MLRSASTSRGALEPNRGFLVSGFWAPLPLHDEGGKLRSSVDSLTFSEISENVWDVQVQLKEVFLEF